VALARIARLFGYTETKGRCGPVAASRSGGNAIESTL